MQRTFERIYAILVLAHGRTRVYAYFAEKGEIGTADLIRIECNLDAFVCHLSWTVQSSIDSTLHTYRAFICDCSCYMRCVHVNYFFVWRTNRHTTRLLLFYIICVWSDTKIFIFNGPATSWPCVPTALRISNDSTVHNARLTTLRILTIYTLLTHSATNVKLKSSGKQQCT